MQIIVPLPAFRDNYIWLLREGSRAVVVDPGDAAPVHAYLAAEGLSLAAILVTHHHADHVGGLAGLLSGAAIPVYGPAGESIAGVSHPLREGDEITLLGTSFRVLDIPGHTAGHIGYYARPALFCGDTLFGAGCGRVFDGTPAQLFASLEKLAALPGDTRVYCTHEYTLANLAFAAAVEPDNPAVSARLARSQALRAASQPTVPFPLDGEHASNPFLRTREPAVIHQAEAHSGRPLASPLEVFTALREWKNHF